MQAELHSPEQRRPADLRGPSISILSRSVPGSSFSAFAPSPEQAARQAVGARGRQPARQARCALQRYGWDAHGTWICIYFFRFGLSPARGMSSHCRVSLQGLRALKKNLSLFFLVLFANYSIFSFSLHNGDSAFYLPGYCLDVIWRQFQPSEDAF